MNKPAITTLAPWFGSNRTLAENVGRALCHCRWVGVPFAGGMCELSHIIAPSVLVSDLHTHVLNLAAVVASPTLNPQLRERLDSLPFHPSVLAGAQERCRERESQQDAAWFGVGLKTNLADLDWAVDYFISAWMSRNGSAGTVAEFTAPQSVRWSVGGGDSVMRFRHATESLAEWSRIMRRCTFIRADVFAFLSRVTNEEGHGLYLDPPFPEVGDSYKFGFSEDDHRRLAEIANGFTRMTVVCRFYDHPLIRKLYPFKAWKWEEFEGRRSTNANDAPEVLLVREGLR